VKKEEEFIMFNTDNFVKACQGQPPSAVKELLEEALRDPESIKEALAAIGSGKNVGEASMGVTVSKNSPLKMIGWAVHGKTISVPRTVVIQLASDDGGKYYAPAARTKRPGLATAFKTPVYEDAGFDIGSVSLSNVPAGQYAVSVIQVSDEAGPDTALVCDAQKKMEVE